MSHDDRATAGTGPDHDAQPDADPADGAVTPQQSPQSREPHEPRESLEPAGGPYAFAPEGGEPGLGYPGTYPGIDPAAVGPEAEPTVVGPDRTVAQRGESGQDAPAGTPTSDAGTPDGATAVGGAGTVTSGPVDPTDERRGGWTPTAPAADAHLKRDRTRTKSSNRPLLLALGAGGIVVALLIWLLTSLFGESDEADLVDPSSLSAGECLSGFTAITEDAALVDCTEEHNAQLLASESYADDAEFPGRDQLGARAEEACADASDSINPDVVTDDLDITLLRATPTEATWADGDRRVDCFAVIENGATMEQSLLVP